MENMCSWEGPVLLAALTAPQARGSRRRGSHSPAGRGWRRRHAKRWVKWVPGILPTSQQNLPGTWSIASSPLSTNLVQVAKDVPGRGLQIRGSSLLCTSGHWAAWARVGHSLGHSGPPSSPNPLLCSSLPWEGLPALPPSSLLSPAPRPDRSLKVLSTQLPSYLSGLGPPILSVSSSPALGHPPRLCSAL